MADAEGFVTVAKRADIPPGEGRAFNVNGKRVAVFQREGKFFAISDTCPHMGASLAEGYLDQSGVLCPWHAWKFCIEDGTWLDQPKSAIRAEPFEVVVIGDEVRVRVPSPSAPHSRPGSS